MLQIYCSLTLRGVECEAPKAPRNEEPKGWSLGGGVPLPVGVRFGGGLCSSPRNFWKIHVEFTHFAEFCEDYNSLRLIKFTKLK